MTLSWVVWCCMGRIGCECLSSSLRVVGGTSAAVEVVLPEMALSCDVATCA